MNLFSYCIQSHYQDYINFLILKGQNFTLTLILEHIQIKLVVMNLINFVNDLPFLVAVVAVVAHPALIIFLFQTFFYSLCPNVYSFSDL